MVSSPVVSLEGALTWATNKEVDEALNKLSSVLYNFVRKKTGVTSERIFFVVSIPTTTRRMEGIDLDELNTTWKDGKFEDQGTLPLLASDEPIC